MRPVMTGWAACFAVTAGLGTAAAQQTGDPAKTSSGGSTFTCTASAGVSKADTARLTGDVQRTGGYKIRITGGSDQVLLSAEPEDPKRTGAVTRVAASIDTVLLRSPYKSEATAQPANIEKQPVQWDKAPAGASSGNRATVSFDLQAIKALPKGDVLVIVNTADGERMCRMSAKERGRVGG